MNWNALPIPAPGNLDTVMRISGRMPGDLFVGFLNLVGVAHSPNGGTMWTIAMSPALGTDSGPFSIAPTPTGNYVYVAGQVGLAVSQDEGANWNPVITRVSLNQAIGLFVFSDTDVYAGVVAGNGSGIIHYGN